MQRQIEDRNSTLYNYCLLSYSTSDIGNETGVYMYPRGLSLVALEIESVNFMQNMGLIKKSRHCMDCNRVMEWQPSDTIDLFRWICLHCKKTCSIRQDSPLETITCRFNKILGVIRAWCNNEEIDRTADRFGVEVSTVMNIFSIAGLAAEKHINENISQWKIGGPGVIVLIDTFPETYFTGNKQSNRPILCLAELKGFPLTISFHPLPTDSAKSQDTVQTIRTKCQSIIRGFIHPESAVVARRNDSICSYEDIISNQPQFNVLASYEGLLKHESMGRSLQTILSTIWEGALYVCMAAQYYPDDLVESFLFSHMWKNKFGDQAFPLILEEIANLPPLK